MDIWGSGCVLYEILTKSPLFPGSNELDQLHRIHAILGTPNPKILKKMIGVRTSGKEYNFPVVKGTGIIGLLPKMTSECIGLLDLLLAYDPDTRITAREVLDSQFFKEYHEASDSRREV
jgi:serine/threonine protein kinase